MGIFIVFGILIELGLIYYTFIFRYAEYRMISALFLLLVPIIFLIFYKSVRLHDYNYRGLGFEIMDRNILDSRCIRLLTCSEGCFNDEAYDREFEEEIKRRNITRINVRRKRNCAVVSRAVADDIISQHGFRPKFTIENISNSNITQNDYDVLAKV
jgi:hypothetical protein